VVSLEPTVYRDCRDHQDQKEKWLKLVLKVNLDQEDFLELLDLKEILDHLVSLGLRAKRKKKASRVPLVLEWTS